MELSTPGSFGLLPEQNKDFRWFAISACLNVAVILAVFCLARTAHRADQDHIGSMRIVLLQPSPRTLPSVKKTFTVEHFHKIPTLKVEQAKIHLVRIPLQPEPQPSVKVNMPMSMPVLATQPISAVKMAPQPKLANLFNTGATSYRVTSAKVAVASFGVSQAQSKNATVGRVATIGSVFGSQSGKASSSAHVGASGFGSGPTQIADKVNGQVKNVIFSATSTKTVSAATSSATKETAPVILSKPIPQYTQEARKLGIQGDVILDVTLTSAGGVQIMGVLHSLGHGLDEQAELAAKKIQFKPATVNGKPVNSRIRISILFELA